MAKIMDPVLPIFSILGYRAIILGSFGGPGTCCRLRPHSLSRDLARAGWPSAAGGGHRGQGGRDRAGRRALRLEMLVVHVSYSRVCSFGCLMGFQSQFRYC